MDQSQPGGRSHASVLACFPPSIGRDVAAAVVKPLRAASSSSPLQTNRQVTWTMEVLRYGLTLPLDDDTVGLCVDVYVDWLTALVSPGGSAPPPISEEPNLYGQKILEHLSCLFTPRSEQVSRRYLPLCQQVLAAVQRVAREGTVLSRDTWETLLLFLLHVSEAVLAPPTAAEQLCDQAVALLLEAWLLSCARCFPPRRLWRAACHTLSHWRWRPSVVEQWGRALRALTSRLLLLTFSPTFPSFKVPQEDAALVPADLDHQRVPHTWFRFLHLLRSPVEVCSQAEEASGEDQLPQFFFRAMRTISTLVNAFLGVAAVDSVKTQQLRPHTGPMGSKPLFRDRLPSLSVAVTRSLFRDRPTSYGLSRPRSGSAPPTPVNVLSVPSALPSTSSPPPQSRRLRALQVTRTTSRPVVTSQWKTSPQPIPVLPACSPSPCSSLSSSPNPSPLRCNVDSLLHLFGGWLFEAALVRSDSARPDRWVAGRAEACGTLCRIFSSKKTGEEVQTVYLSRFYQVLLQALQEPEGACPRVQASILLSSRTLFCCDLRGVNLLFPAFLFAVAGVLLDREPLRFKGLVSLVDLRRASIYILLSLLPLPLQFPSSQSQLGTDDAAGDFLSLRPRLHSVLIGALHTETDTTNTQMILAALLNLLQDSAAPRAAAVQRNWASATWLQSLHLLCQRLGGPWRTDWAVCLSALEVLAGLAKVEVSTGVSDRQGVLEAVCGYIEYQCGRPPTLHSRDLHSVVVAAFHCLSVWITQHAALLDRQESLAQVLETVELGLSGSRSRQEQEVRRKEEKELSPASLRVKEAAEATLSCVMQVSGAWPHLCARPGEPELLGCRGDSRSFRYFVVDNSIIMATLDHPGVSSPSLSVLLRGASGGHGWTLQLHLQPREGRTPGQCSPVSKCSAAAQQVLTAGPRDQQLPGDNHTVLSILGLDQPIFSEQEQQQLWAVFENQRQVEARVQLDGPPTPRNSCRPPGPVTSFQTTRLLLSTLGLLSPEALRVPSAGGVPPQLGFLDSSRPGFLEDLSRLDELPSRHRDSALVFCMRAGQRTAAEVLKNVESSSSVPPHFLDFLSSLGLPVGAGQRPVGGVNTSTLEFPPALGDSGGGVFDGQRLVLAHRDALSEVTFTVPSPSSHTKVSDWLKTPEEAGLQPASSQQSGPAEDRKWSLWWESRLLVVWVERSEDVDLFPLAELLPDPPAPADSRSDIQLLFIHPLRTGLFRIFCRGNTSSKFGLVVPLVSGSVVSRRSLGFLVRQTVVNSARRRQLESDSAPFPHVRRRHMISDIIQRYGSAPSQAAFHSALFRDL
ncbi:ral GTPase-activating protein subunit beta [Nelusetta ayraudi]|uniref:ral GTPase-activating protein subunit beta n=1 Tax=Nelusetta ayraudi TaxID=303726 RepID=UPI003F709CB2